MSFTQRLEGRHTCDDEQPTAKEPIQLLLAPTTGTEQKLV